MKYKESPVDSFYDGGNKNFPDSIAYLYFDMFNLYECDEYGLGDHKIRLPNVFTPNADNANDVWFISGSCIQDIECVIVNRWGEIMTTLQHGATVTHALDGEVVANDAEAATDSENISFSSSQELSGRTTPLERSV